MKMRDVAEVTLKILGVYVIVEAALKIPVLVFLLHALLTYNEARLPPEWSMATQAGQFAVYLAGGILLIWCARRIADWLLRDDAALSSGDVQIKVVSPESFQFCVKLIGVYALFRAAELLAQGAGRAQLEQYAYNSRVSYSFLLPYLPGVLVLALALSLLRGEWLTRFAWPERADVEDDAE